MQRTIIFGNKVHSIYNMYKDVYSRKQLIAITKTPLIILSPKCGNMTIYEVREIDSISRPLFSIVTYRIYYR